MSSRSLRSGGRRTKPNAALYVGYVEDDETTDMIMKKFAAMEQIISSNKKAPAGGNPGSNSNNASKAEMSDSDEEAEAAQANADALTEEQLVQLFHGTSYYSVNSLQKNNEIMFQKQTLDEDGFVVGIDDPDYQQLMFEVDYNPAGTAMVDWMNSTEDVYVGEQEFWNEADEQEEHNLSRRSKSGAPRSRSSGGRRSGPTRQRFAGHDIGSSSLRRVDETSSKASAADDRILCHEPCYLKVPTYPIPRSWLKQIKRCDPRSSLSQFTGCHYQEQDILNSMRTAKDYFFANNADKEYRAILMDPPFDLSDSPVHIQEPGQPRGTVTLEDFRRLPIGKVVPEGQGAMLFIWVPSELTMQVCDVCEDWGFLLVEHATWIMRNIAHQIENRASNLLGISKQNLLLFRKTKKNGKSFGRLELRHQRTSDSYFDFVRYHPETGRELKSDYHYKLIETMLPDLDQKEKGNGLYLWAPKDERRDGWTCVMDTKYLEELMRCKPDMSMTDW